MVPKFTSQGSRAIHNRSQRTVQRLEVGQNSAQGIVTFGRNVLICSNLSYCNCFEYIRSFIARVKLPSVSIEVVVLIIGTLARVNLAVGIAPGVEQALIIA